MNQPVLAKSLPVAKRPPFDPINNEADRAGTPIASWGRTARSMFCYWSPAVRGAMAKSIARSLQADSVRALPRLSDAQLYEGFFRSFTLGERDFNRESLFGLTPGEVFALVISVLTNSSHLATGGCLLEIMQSVGIEDHRDPAALLALGMMGVFQKWGDNGVAHDWYEAEPVA